MCLYYGTLGYLYRETKKSEEKNRINTLLLLMLKKQRKGLKGQNH